MKNQLFCLLTLFLPLLSPLSLILTQKSVLAQSVRFVSLDHAQSHQEAIVIDVHEGFGFNISLLNTDEVIVFLVLDNPAQYSLTLDGSPCDNEPCVSQLIHIRLLKGINLPNVTTSSNQHTLLTVKTVDSQNRPHLRVFRLQAKKGEPKYHTLVLESPQSPQNSAVMTAGNTLDLNHITQGMIYAQAGEKLPDNPQLWQRVQDFIVLVRQGTPYLEAAYNAGISLSVIHQLEAWGKEFMDLKSPIEAKNF